METDLGPGYYSKSAKLLIMKGQEGLSYKVEPIQTKMLSFFLLSVVQWSGGICWTHSSLPLGGGCLVWRASLSQDWACFDLFLRCLAAGSWRGSSGASQGKGQISLPGCSYLLAYLEIKMQGYLWSMHSFPTRYHICDLFLVGLDVDGFGAILIRGGYSEYSCCQVASFVSLSNPFYQGECGCLMD